MTKAKAKPEAVSAAPASVTPPGHKRVICHVQVNHDCVPYAIGEEFTLPDAQALALLAVGAVSEVPADGER